MPTPDNATTRTRDRIFAILGHLVRRNDPAERKVDVETNKSLYDENELAMLRPAGQAGQQTSSRQFNNLKQHLQSTSDNVAKMIEENESFASMLPEADKARAIYVPSILSPTDMYGHNLTVSFDGITLETNLENTLCDIISKLINEDLELGTNLQPWIGDALFKKGATPVMVVPRALITQLASDKEGEEGTLSIQQGDVADNTDLQVGTESLDITPAFLKEEGGAGVVSVGVEHMAAFMDLHEDVIKEKAGSDDLSGTMNKLMLTMKGDLDISLDIGRIKGSTEAVQDAVEKFEAKTAGKLCKLGTSSMIAISADSAVTKEVDEPVIMRLPTSSVIPVTVPGSPEARLGYFVVIDSTGNPLNADIPSKTEAAISKSEFMTVFREDRNVMIDNMAAEKRSEVASDVFDILINHVLDQSLQGINEASYNIINNRNLSLAIFSKMLRKKKVSFIFVPTTHMAYYAFDYREDGTGKTLLEDASTLISLRTACIVAKVVSVMDNARDNRRIEYSIPDASSANVEQMNALLERMYVDKHMFKPSHNTSNIFRDLVKNSVSVAPKELEGLRDFSVTTETTNPNLSSVDDSLEEMLTRMITLFLRVPAGAIDDVHEKDFSRSVATTNLLFSNDVRLAQKITCRETAIIMRAYILNSAKTMTAIDKAVTDTTSFKLEDGVTKLDLIRHIISKMKLSLPSPNVSPDKARLNEISENLRTLDEVIEALWPETLIINGDDEAIKSLNAFKQMIKHYRVRDLVANSGDVNLASIPGLEEMNPEELRKLNQVMLNIAAMSKRMQEALKAADEAGDSGGGGSRW